MKTHHAARPGTSKKPTEDRWLSVGEIADYLGVATASVYRWIDRKGLPAHKLGKLWKAKQAEVDQWVRSRATANSRPSTNNQPQQQR